MSSRDILDTDALWAGAFIALAVILPALFHAAGLGARFLPMFVPIMTAVLFLRPGYSFLAAVLSPLVSSVITGMPPLYPPVVVLMALEGLVIIAVCAAARAITKNMYAAAVAGIAAAQTFSSLLVWQYGTVFGFPGGVIASARFVSSVPGMILVAAAAPWAAGYITRITGRKGYYLGSNKEVKSKK